MSAPNGNVGSLGPGTSMKAKKSVNGKVSRAVTGLTGMYLLVAGAVSCSWLVGFLDFSFVWSFMLIASLFIVWKAKISKIIKQHLDFEETELYRRRAFRHNETVEWLNFLMNRWWVFSSYTIEQLIKRRLNERLWDIKPQFLNSLEMVAFSSGEQTPNVRNVKVFEYCEGMPNGQKSITWFNVNKPPAGLNKMSTYQLGIQFDVQMMAEDFSMIFRARVGSKKVNVAFDMAVEELMLTGTLQAIVQISMDVPFPHISKVTTCFIKKPDITFNLRMLKALQMMEVPLLKSWIHTNVMEGLTQALVDPASVDLPVAKTGPIEISRKQTNKDLAHGVLTIQIKGFPPKDGVAEDIRYTVLRIGELKRQTHDVPANEEWEDVCTFFIYSLGKEKIHIKSKCKRLLTSTTLEQTKLNLSSFPFQVKSFHEKNIDLKDGSKLQLIMQYTALPVIDLNSAEQEKPKKVTEGAGVMYICIHGASSVKVADKTGASDPYCVLFCNRRRLLTTPYVPCTRNPRWESWVEFFVGDFTTSTYSFFVFDWDGNNSIDDDFLGVAHLSLGKEESKVVKRTLTLGYNRPDEGFTPDKTCGTITVSLVFRPVASVAKSERFRKLHESYKGDEYLYREDHMSPATTSTYVRSRRLSVDEDEPDGTDDAGGDIRKSTSANAYLNEYLEDKIITELTILQGKDMMAMDRNGYSDPFCIVSLNGKKVFTTSVKKKTLFPKWNETLTVEMKEGDSSLTIDVFDKDVISKDFMGALTLTVEKLKELSVKGTSEWFLLERTKSGQLQLKCQVIAKDTIKCSPPSPEPEVFHSSEPPKKPSVPKPVVDKSPVVSPDPNDNDHSLAVSPSPKLRRSYSDLAVEKTAQKTETTFDTFETRNYNTLPRNTTPQMRHSVPLPSTLSPHTPGANYGSLHGKDRGDTASIDEKDDNCVLNTTAESLASNVSYSDKYFSVAGTVHRARGLEGTTSEVYCKVRWEQPGSRISLFSGTRVIGKSKLVPSSDPNFNLKFEIDKGHGVSPDACVIFDIKSSSRQHVSTKTFSLRSLLHESEGVRQWFPLENGVELQLSFSTGQQTPHTRRRIFKSLSFRKDK